MTAPWSARLVDTVIDHGLLPDAVLRRAIRRLLRARRRAITAGTVEERSERERALLDELRAAPVAVETSAANDQHYEVPAAFFEAMLGPRLKYSCAHWPPGTDTLAQAEDAMIDLTIERAGLSDGQDILELGCGWGSLTLALAHRFPNARIVAVSNATEQRRLIEDRAAAAGYDNVTVLTADVNELGTGGGAGGADGRYAAVVRDGAFDRVISVEMFEHVRNHGELTTRIARWLRPGGSLFVHVFAHRSDAYLFETGGRADWMARHFFTGGIMPSHDLLLLSVSALACEQRWAVSGQHYARTLRAWLDRLDADPRAALAALDTPDAPVPAVVALRRWRVFTIACEELFAAQGGDEWHVSHYRFERTA